LRKLYPQNCNYTVYSWTFLKVKSLQTISSLKSLDFQKPIVFEQSESDDPHITFTPVSFGANSK